MSEPRRYHSVLADAMHEFLSYKRALGRRFATEERQLLLLDRFLVERRVGALDEIGPELLDQFLLSRRHRVPKSYNSLLGVVRRLLDWMVGQEMLARSPLRARPRRETGSRVPVIFDPPLVRALLDLALQLPERSRAPLRGATYRMAFALMYGLGLRAGEASRLQVGDLDLAQRLLWIRQSKFGKTRQLPVGPHLADALREFLALRHARWGPSEPSAPLLTFNGLRPVSANRISSTFQLLMPRLGFLTHAHHQPRAHDLRHSFAVGTLLRWYREGYAPGDRLIYLSAFLGHAGIHSTAVYLTITADLLGQASRRFEPFAAEALGKARR